MHKFITELFGKSPFGPIVEHSKKVHECVELLWPIMETLVDEDFENLGRLRSRMARLEYEADLIKHEIRGFITQRSFLPVDRSLDRFLLVQRKQDVGGHADDQRTIKLQAAESG